jgi:NAD(P)H-dependent flavin oxidoreductase YrpB (nitropropane dioxygenase family)
MNKLPFLDRLTIPAIAAPMLRVSGYELVSAACEAGVVGAFPTANCASLDEPLPTTPGARRFAPTSSCAATRRA